MQLVSEEFMRDQRLRLQLHEIGHDPIQFRIGLFETLKQIRSEFDTPPTREIVKQEEIELAYEPQSYIHDKAVFLCVEDIPVKKFESSKDFFDHHYDDLKGWTCVLIRAIWTHPDFRKLNYAACAVECLQEVTANLERHFLMAMPKPFELEFSPAYVNFYQEMAALKEETLSHFFTEIESTDEEKAELNNFWTEQGFSIKVPKQKLSTTPLIWKPE